MVNMALAMIVGVAPQIFGSFRWQPSLSDCLETFQPPPHIVSLDQGALIVHGFFKLVNTYFVIGNLFKICTLRCNLCDKYSMFAYFHYNRFAIVYMP